MTHLNENLTVSSIEEISEKYFNNTKTKHLKEFDETTPNGNHITGYINQKPNKHLGSMIILTVNDEAVEQYIQSMPKINYPTDERDIFKSEMGKDYPCYEKLDGSCLILYPLKNHNDEIIEIVPKTRGRPVADSHFIDLFHKVDMKPIQDYYKENEGNLLFELYGILNQHDIIHYNTGIDLALIAIYENNGELKGFHNEKNIIEKYNFRLPDKIFELYTIKDNWYVKWCSEKYKGYIPDELKDEDKQYPDSLSAVLGMKHYLEELNKKFNEVNNRLATEGVVINAISVYEDEEKLKWWKCKPRDIEAKHKSVNGIPRNSITKEVYKYFDEYGSDVRSIYDENPEHHTEYLHRMLSEEYNEDLILKSKNKIEKIFMEVWENKEVPESIHNICNDLFEQYGSEGIGYCMKMFAEKYPMKKKDARLIYGVLEKVFIKNNCEL